MRGGPRKTYLYHPDRSHKGQSTTPGDHAHHSRDRTLLQNTSNSFGRNVRCELRVCIYAHPSATCGALHPSLLDPWLPTEPTSQGLTGERVRSPASTGSMARITRADPAKYALLIRMLRLGIFQEPQPFSILCSHHTTVCISQPSGMVAVSALDSGLLDAAVLGSVPWAAAVARGVSISTDYIVHVKDKDQGLVARRTGTTTPGDLAGMRIGAVKHSTTHQGIAFLIDLFDLKNVTIEFMENSRMLEAWDAGRIDAAYCWGKSFDVCSPRTHCCKALARA